MTRLNAHMAKMPNEWLSSSQYWNGTNPAPRIPSAWFNCSSRHAEMKGALKASPQNMIQMDRLPRNIEQAPNIEMERFCVLHRQITALASGFSVRYMLERKGVVRSIWKELNGSIKAVSLTYRCVTPSRSESEFPFCGHIDLSKTGKSSLLAKIQHD